MASDDSAHAGREAVDSRPRLLATPSCGAREGAHATGRHAGSEAVDSRPRLLATPSCAREGAHATGGHAGSEAADSHPRPWATPSCAGREHTPQVGMQAARRWTATRGPGPRRPARTARLMAVGSRVMGLMISQAPRHLTGGSTERATTPATQPLAWQPSKRWYGRSSCPPPLPPSKPPGTPPCPPGGGVMVGRCRTCTNRLTAVATPLLAACAAAAGCQACWPFRSRSRDWVLPAVQATRRDRGAFGAGPGGP